MLSAWMLDKLAKIFNDENVVLVVMTMKHYSVYFHLRFVILSLSFTNSPTSFPS